MANSQDLTNEKPRELSSRIDSEAKMEIHAGKNFSQSGVSTAEGKESCSDEKLIVEGLHTKADIQTDVKETVSQGKAIGDFNTEANMTTDDLERAGGFGATDDISSLLPVALDSTDFEASLLNARNYEEEQGEVSRPGLGWSKTSYSD